MKQSFFWCFPWDLEDEGTEAALGRMAGEIGVDAVSVATTYRRLSAFRPRVLSGAKTIQQPSAAHFQPDRPRYLNTRIRPITASWMRSRNPLEQVARLAQKNGLALRTQAVCCDSDSLVARYPFASCIDVFGDPMPTWLCPSHPDVREYVAGLVEDLSTNYPVETVELDGAHFGAYSDLRGREYHLGIRPGEVESILLSWCFCSACRQRASDAGVDVDSVASSVKGHLERMTRVEVPSVDSLLSLLADDCHMAGYHQMRARAVTSLLRMARARTKVRLVVHVRSLSHSSGVDLSALAEECDGFILSEELSRATPLDSKLVDAAGGVEKIEVARYCYPPYVKEGPALVQAVRRAWQQGYAGIGFFNYGLAPEPCLEWIRQALRFARREGSC